MIETFTRNQDSLSNGKKQEENIMEAINQTELNFYESITPVLNNLIKNPSDDVIDRILAFSKSI